jgi:hypothetical protein
MEILLSKKSRSHFLSIRRGGEASKHHFTVELPSQITQEVADTIHGLFFKNHR